MVNDLLKIFYQKFNNIKYILTISNDKCKIFKSKFYWYLIMAFYVIFYKFNVSFKCTFIIIVLGYH